MCFIYKHLFSKCNYEYTTSNHKISLNINTLKVNIARRK